MGQWIYLRDPGEETTTGPGGFILLTILLAIVGFVVAIFAAFLLVGVTWGVFTSLRNYCRAIGQEGRSLKNTISMAWALNVESMQVFFDGVRDYTHILKALVKPFLLMCGIGVIFVGTLCLPFYITLHALGLLLSWPFRREKKGTGKNPDENSYVKDPKALDARRTQLRLTDGSVGLKNRELTENEQAYLELYNKFAEDGGLSDMERTMLDVMRDRMGLSKARARALECHVPVKVVR